MNIGYQNWIELGLKCLEYYLYIWKCKQNWNTNQNVILNCTLKWNIIWIGMLETMESWRLWMVKKMLIKSDLKIVKKMILKWTLILTMVWKLKCSI